MTAPHLAQGMPANESWFADQIRSLQRQISELRAAQTLNAATVGTGGISSSNFDGTLNPPAGGTQGWGMAGGPAGTIIAGTLIVRDGIIGDDALTNPVSPAIVHADVAGFTLSTTPTAILTGTAAVPDGFSQALVMAVGMVTAQNTRGVTDGLSMYVEINGVSVSRNTLITLAAGQQQSATGAAAALIGPLGSSTFPIKIWATAGGGTWSPGGGMQANIDATVLFLR